MLMRELYQQADIDSAVLCDEWRGMYREGWTGLIHPDSFQHPAKFSRALIRKIYDHVIAEGWATKGDSVVDPFGGVALGGFDAMRHGLNWFGCELEQKFVELGGRNIELWNERYSLMPNWGSARLLQGDSRKLAEVFSVDVDACVSSPPYVLARQDTTKVPPTLGHIYGEDEQDRIAALCDHRYGQSEGQLGAMKEGDHSIAISSPPYIESMERAGGIDAAKSNHVGGPHSQMNRSDTRYGSSEGQLGAMPEGQLCVTSPPYNPPMSQDHNGSRGGQRGTTPSEKGAFVKYGNSDGQLEGMSIDGFNAAISSPPWEKGAEGYLRKDKFKDPAAFAAEMYSHDGVNGRHGCSLEARIAQIERDQRKTYGDTEGQMGQQSGETFWSASRLILQQLHQVLSPNAHAVFVVKSFVRDKRIVDFPAQWAQLCEAVGFKLLHDHHALLIEKGARQPAMNEFDIQGDTWRIVTRDKDHTVARKSFFRRLAEAKGSPRIDYEQVLCFRRS